ncbi:probable calcium-binding protein CML31 [Phalaenopsis equestris]|uniref:probable calcium-binding protein CML31 n=1 Tax=Phalaenopsis equestris TaxID=78828 RepID=UPI0009E1AC07|nr:probable calcium-binding protein CML31 [Phalaenopsis equestris]
MRSVVLGELEKVFRCFDEDGDGEISPAELRSCMRVIGHEMTWEEAEALVQSVDSDGDGLLAMEEFIKLVEAEGGDEEEELRQAFAMYEMDGQGCITPKSLKRMLSRLGASRDLNTCEVMIQRFDINGDGVLCFEEFKAMMAN